MFIVSRICSQSMYTVVIILSKCLTNHLINLDFNVVLNNPTGAVIVLVLLLTILVLISLMDAEWWGQAEIIMCGVCTSA